MYSPSPTEDIPLPALGSWRQAASRCGFPIEPVFQALGISLTEPAVQTKLPAVRLLKAFGMCVERAQGHPFTLALGECFMFEHFAELETFVSSCTTIRQILEVAGWAKGLLTPWMTLHLDEFGSEAHLRVELTPAIADPRAAAHIRESLLAAIHQLGLRATGGANWLLSVRVTSPAGPYQKQFIEHFGVPVTFGDSADALVMDRRWLDQPLNAPVPDALSLARQQVERRLTREIGERRIVEEVRWALERCPDLLREGLEATAAAMGLHARTLQRRLQAEGVKYVDIQSEAKRQRAQTMLRRRAISMELISTELGFSDRRAFTFAFKRWTGLAPSAYRAQLDAQPR
jgi:AraC-like DNA-binding protein